MEWSTNKLIWRVYFLFGFITPVCWTQKLPTLNFSFGEEENITTTLKFLETTTEFLQTATQTVCEQNITCLQNVSFPKIPIGVKTTAKPGNQTTATPISLTPTKTSIDTSKHTPPLNFNDKDICICNLKVQYCDLNCCCDQDCSLADKQVFDHCEEDFHYYDTRYCNYKKHIYINKTSHIQEVNQNVLFCLARNNEPASYILQQKNLLKSLEETYVAKKSKYGWPGFQIDDDIRMGNFSYIYKTPLWVIRKNVISAFELETNFIGVQCLARKKIEYLKNIKISCSRTDLSDDNLSLQPYTYFANLSIIASPDRFNQTKYIGKNILQVCPKNICVPIEPQICEDYFENCVNVSKNSTNLQHSCQISIGSRKLHCNNLVQQIKYNFVHNGTKGVVKALVFLVLKNASFGLGEEAEFLQDFEVNFKWFNHTLNYSSYLSGNPGYIVGKPIVIGNLISQNVSLKNFSAPDFRHCFMTLPKVNSEGYCLLTKNNYMPIEFGYNMYSKCVISENVLSKNVSGAEICANVQKTIFKYWSLNVTNNTLNNRVIGQFGNANHFNNNDWLNVLFLKDLNTVINNTWGKIDKKANLITCGNISSWLLIEFFYSRVDFGNVLNQNKILATAYHFNNLENFTFRYNPKSQAINFQIKIKSQIMFYDITTKKVKKFVDPPSLSIKLPYDFFYPFVKLPNSSAIAVFMPMLNVLMLLNLLL